jgi:dTDP-3-amino-2,3,6-trideoxy-4-keto-D-glucose/dTDP-3-amino-3,4,6-trideoxy-alpha-D-glucose/dTDP-2,6-dideoxy-D-kanosamine transaminase
MKQPHIRMFDYRAELPELRARILSAVERVLDSGSLILGPEVLRFEGAMAESLGGGQAIGVGNGTDALTIALWARGIGAGDEVITVANTAVPTANAIICAGAKPVFCDIDPKTGLLDVNRVRELVGPSTRAVIPVHLYGNAVNMPALMEVASQHKLFVIEDCAQAQGGTLNGQALGSLGHAATFSFYPTKNLGAYGDGGLCFTRDAALADEMRRVRYYGFESRDYAVGRGMNSRLDELHAAILSEKLPLLSGYVKRRRTLAALYDAELPQHVTRLRTTEGCEHARHLYVVRVRDRDALAARLLAVSIDTGVHYRRALHHMPAFQAARLPDSGLPHTEAHAREVLSLPLHPTLTEDDVVRVCREISRNG